MIEFNGCMLSVLGEKLETGCVICLQQTELIKPPSVMDRAKAGCREGVLEWLF